MEKFILSIITLLTLFAVAGCSGAPDRTLYEAEAVMTEHPDVAYLGPICLRNRKFQDARYVLPKSKKGNYISKNVRYESLLLLIVNSSVS
ncbi:MAG: hypothetical protein K2G17_01295 [Duncaniella sp.]|nr:hypothetical protein [Duncaniella sp.]MDE6186751.1 hypothetical protein [Duncaniella sp.]